MPLFRYSFTRGPETKVVELRRSNPQGWLPDAVRAAFPDVSSRRHADVLRWRLQTVDGARQTWKAILPDEPIDLVVLVTQTRI